MQPLLLVFTELAISANCFNFKKSIQNSICTDLSIHTQIANVMEIRNYGLSVPVCLPDGANDDFRH